MTKKVLDWGNLWGVGAADIPGDLLTVAMLSSTPANARAVRAFIALSAGESAAVQAARERVGRARIYQLAHKGFRICALYACLKDPHLRARTAPLKAAQDKKYRDWQDQSLGWVGPHRGATAVFSGADPDRFDTSATDTWLEEPYNAQSA